MIVPLNLFLHCNSLYNLLHIQLNRRRGVSKEVRSTRTGVLRGSLYLGQPVVFYDFADAQL